MILALFLAQPSIVIPSARGWATGIGFEPPARLPTLPSDPVAAAPAAGGGGAAPAAKAEEKKVVEEEEEEEEMDFDLVG